MVKKFHVLLAACSCVLLFSSRAMAQDIDLTTGGAELIWYGTAANARAGTWFDQGAVSASDSRRDLIMAALLQ